jgi:hypothetical protein
MPSLGIRPKRFTLNSTVNFFVYGDNLDAPLASWDFYASDPFEWLDKRLIRTTPNFILFQGKPRRIRGTREDGDLTVTLEFDDGTMESVTFDDITYEETLMKGKKGGKAGARKASGRKQPASSATSALSQKRAGKKAAPAKKKKAVGKKSVARATGR